MTGHVEKEHFCNGSVFSPIVIEKYESGLWFSVVNEQEVLFIKEG